MQNSISKEESRLIALFRAINRYGMDTFIRLEDVGTLAEYLPHVFDVDDIELDTQADLDIVLDAYVAGFVANRLVNAGLRPADMQQPGTQPGYVEEEPHLSQNQSGIDATTGEIRH